ncbi:hypothetical protein D3C75_1072550 [compost metagenome]
MKLVIKLISPAALLAVIRASQSIAESSPAGVGASAEGAVLALAVGSGELAAPADSLFPHAAITIIIMHNTIDNTIFLLHSTLKPSHIILIFTLSEQVIPLREEPDAADCQHHAL